MSMRSKLGIDATKKQPGEGFKRAWPPLNTMDETVKAKMEKLFSNRQECAQSHGRNIRSELCREAYPAGEDGWRGRPLPRHAHPRRNPPP
jgi:hypothetical protein